MKESGEKRKQIRAPAFALAALVFVLSGLMSAAAWTDFTQSRTNTFRGSAAKTAVTLHKYEKSPDGLVRANPVANALFRLVRVEGETETPVGGTYATGADGKITAGKLQAGEYRFIESDPGWGYAPDLDGDGRAVTRYPFTVTPEQAKEGAGVEVTAYNRRREGSFSIAKTVKNADGGALTQTQKEKAFAFTVTFADGGTYGFRIGGGNRQSLKSGGSLELKHNETAAFEGLPAGLLYTVSENPEPGYAAESADAQGSVVPGGGKTAAFTNVYDETPSGDTELTVKKRVTGTVPPEDAEKEFWFTLNLAGRAPVRFSLKSGESSAFSIPAGTAYTVTEDDYFAAGYILSAAQDGVSAPGKRAAVFTNTYVGAEWVEISGVKSWKNLPPGVSPPAGITVRLMDGGTAAQTRAVTAESGWEYAFTAPKHDASGREIAYTVEEAPVSGYRAEVKGFDIENTYLTPASGDPPVVRKTVTGEKAPAAVFRFRMAAKDGAPMPEGSAGGVKTVELTGPGEREFGVMTFTDPGVYVYEISEIDMGDPGYTYDPGVYTLTFTVAAEGSALTVKSRTLTKSGNAAEAAAFANAYKAPDSPGGETTVVSGAKSWNHGDNPLENRPASITVLIRDGERIAARAVVTGAEHWQWSFKLPKYRADGSEIRYTADEEPVPGYTKAADGYNLMNSHESARPGEVTLSGRKTWDYKNAPADDRPESVTVYIKNGEETVRELTVTETAGWRWSVQLPLNGEDGRPVSYTVEEANVPHYTHRVERYDILNTYKSKNYPGDNPPATGEEDGGDLGPWLALFVCSAATMCVLLLMKRRERRGGKYYR